MAPAPIISGACLAALVLGSVHAYSVFLIPLETQHAVTRATASLPYSVALAAISVAVLIGPRIYSRCAPHLLLSASLALSALALLATALAPNMTTVLLAYGLGFGLANGLGYGFGLQLAAQAAPRREAWAMGAVTATYALGAALASFPLDWAITNWSMQTALAGLALTLAVTAPVTAFLLRAGKAQFTSAANKGGRKHSVGLLWLAYTTAVAAGLMVIGHASAIAQVRGVAAPWLAPILIALGNLVGSFVGGYLGDRVNIARLLTATAALATTALAAAALMPNGTLTLLSLTLVGLTYGATIALFPAFIAKRFGVDDGPTVYGRVFTGWGLMGLTAPWLAGALFDVSGTYTLPLLCAAFCAFAALILSLRL